MFASLEALRQPSWTTPARMVAYGRLLAGLPIALAIGWLAFSRGLIDPAGSPVGADFLSFYAASALALGDRVADVYRPALHHAAQAALVGRPVDYAAFFYPPPFLLVCLPLALVPYLAALAAWIGATGAAFVIVLRRFLAGTNAGLVAILAFPAVLLNAGHGQNGFLTTALLGGMALALGPRPILAGLLIGGLAIKPHLAILLPFGLMFLGAWRAIGAAAVAGLALCAASWLILGVEAWQGFSTVSTLARSALESELVGSAKMVSVFAAFRLLGAGLATAYAAQAAVFALVLVALWRLARARPDPLAFGVAMVAATSLASPFLLDYDLTLLAVPLAWLLREANRDGFRPWEQAGMIAAFLLPLFARSIALGLSLPLAPPVLFILSWLVLRRAHATCAKAPSSRGPA